MKDASSITELNGFLANHESVAKPKLFAIGSDLGEWRVTAFLGSGGNAEVYRVVRIDGVDGRARTPVAPQPEHNEGAVKESVGALKVLLREDDASKKRFRQEVALLSAQMGRHFAKFYASGEVNGRPYHVCELLEPVDLPENEREIADYLLTVCKAVDALHRAGLIHRDIKPSNIMRRANGELVLIDLGLVKDAVKSSSPERDVSIVDGKAVAIGTPRFAAPEQMIGGEVTAVVDVHAIGRLADVAFHSDPPRPWLPIIRRATSSIPTQRYPSADALATAIRHRNGKRNVMIAAATVGLLAFVVSATIGLWRTTIGPTLAWRSLCENVTTNLVVKELAWERLVTNKVGNSTMVVPERAYRQVQKPSDITIVHLNGKTNEFDRPIVLSASREYFIEGPGILAANIQAAGGIARVHLMNCYFFNRSAVPIDKANIRYVFDGGAYLNFTEQDELPRSVINEHIEEFDGANNVIDYKGPSDPTGYGICPSRKKSSFYKNLHSPRHFFASSGKYVVESMEKKDTKAEPIDESFDFHLDPNRIRTVTEIQLFADVFSISFEEARRILTKAGRRCEV